MSVIVGSGEFRYEIADGWEQLPAGWEHGDVAGVATDSRDRVYVFNRGAHPMIVYERDGTFLGSWGEGVFANPHGITIVNDLVYCADALDHTVRTFTLDGTLLRELGTVGVPSDTGHQPGGEGNLRSIRQASGPFNRPTRVAVAPSGELYVSDGYGNARVHRFSADGQLLNSWGGPGSGPGEFQLPHSVWVHHDGRVFVCDRENDRIQIFSPSGEYLSSWPATRPADLFIDSQDRVFVGELSWTAGAMSISGRIWPDSRHSQMSVRDLEGNLLASWGGPDPCTVDGLAAPHGIWVDRHGDVYVGEVTFTALGRTSRYSSACHSLVKFIRA